MSSDPFNTMSSDPFKKLVKLAARAFYDDMSTKGDNQPKTGRSDNRGIAVVVLDALTRRQWVREEDFAKELKLHSKQLRRTLRYFEEEKLIARDHRKETAKGAKLYSNAVAATADGQSNAKEGEEKIKLHTHSYCCLDYAQIFDIVRYRVHRMKKKIKEELDDKNTIQKYVCPNCGKRYDALDAMRLVSMEDENFHCERCNGELVAESDKLVAESDKLVAQGGDGDDNARRRRREKLNDMLQKIEVQLKPLFEQLNRVKDLPVPEFRSLQAWEAQASAAARLSNDPSSSDPSRGHQFATPMPFPGEAKVEVAFSGGGKDENFKSENENTSLKVLPPWMIRQGMNLTKEQRGEALQESKMSGSSLQRDFSDDKKQIGENVDKKSLQDEYLKAYYAALLQKQEEMRAAVKGNDESNEPSALSSLSESPDRLVGMKSKREEYEKDEDVEWEEAPVADNGIENYKVNDLNVEAEPSAEDDEDDVDWEEG